MMPFSYIDFAIASGIFLIFISFLLGKITDYLNMYINKFKISELRLISFTIFKILFGSPGTPSNWEETLEFENVGLMNKLYSIAINVTSMEEIPLDLLINGTLQFDPNCERKIRNNTLRLYNSSSLVPFQLYNQTFCENGYLKSGEIVFESYFLPSETKVFTLYFSSEKNIAPPNYSVEFPSSPQNYIFQAYPIQEFEMISVDKLIGLRKLKYEEVVGNLSKGFGLRVEIE